MPSHYIILTTAITNGTPVYGVLRTLSDCIFPVETEFRLVTPALTPRRQMDVRNIHPDFIHQIPHVPTTSINLPIHQQWVGGPFFAVEGTAWPFLSSAIPLMGTDTPVTSLRSSRVVCPSIAGSNPNEIPHANGNI